MGNLSQIEVGKIEKLNAILVKHEEDIYTLAKREHDILKTKTGLVDYELNVDISFYKEEGENPLVSWEENMKQRFTTGSLSPISNKKNHNVTSTCWKQNDLNSQHHCWLLHRLYDDFFIPWAEILEIKHIWYDIQITYQYTCDIDLES
ncbi:hypothetical protein JHD49_01515 [Sulfurimonas sp. SAG-AH-194-C21]|nr:hypothetical protein [Sulfurimonas sp. SAG-AH-194-C21]MDF1882613.1 hypothetical protein [Sulfurimonas sp. SAG-AH-194-C21]